MFKYFTDKETNQSIAVNPSRVKYVRDFGMGPKLVFDDGSYIIVMESYLDAVARLNEV
jgi:hypothetical protein